VQRTCQTRLISDKLAGDHLLGLAGWSSCWPPSPCPWAYQSKEYAELEWPIDLLITVVWVAYAIVFFGTIMKRKTSHIYVANWFFGAFIVTVAVLHLVNSAALPVTGPKSYRPTPAPSTRWCSGGTATTRWASS
jgi:cytochrome c oxidase cbb3-type subunit 1